MTEIVTSILLTIIIWQGKSELSDWFFLGRDFAIRTVSMETVHAVYFFGFRKPRRQIQTTKRKRSNTLIFAKKLPKRLIFNRAYNKNEEHKYSRSEFFYPEDLIQRLTQASANVKAILQRSKKVQTQIRRWQLI